MLPHYQFYALEYTAMVFPISSSRGAGHEWLFCGSELYLTHDQICCFGSAINSEAEN